MKTGLIEKRDIRRLLDKWAKNRAVYCPVQRNGLVALEKLTAQSDVLLDHAISKVPTKSVFLPQSEVLCTFEDDEVREAALSNEKAVLFGVRPCDARALLCLDTVFGGDNGVKDPYYFARRTEATIVALACNEPLPGCFCTSVGGGPADRTGADIIVSDIGDSLLFQACTDRGEALMTECANAFRKPGKSETKRAATLAENAGKGMSKVSIEGLKEKLDKSFDSAVWDSIAQTCLGCGVCTYLCPTCHCFDMTDETDGKRGERIRTWDSCQYSLFTLHASGHNPRPSPTERMRQRIMHKLCYAPENFDQVFCVGCGRCVRNCPVNLDIRETITLLNC